MWNHKDTTNTSFILLYKQQEKLPQPASINILLLRWESEKTSFILHYLGVP